MSHSALQQRIVLAATSNRVVRWVIVPAIYAICGLGFVTDLVRSNTIAYGIVYVPMIATAVLHRSRWGLWLLTGVSLMLVLIGALFPIVDPDLPDLIANRVLSILAILVTAGFVHHARSIQERLAAQTHRAEAAEQIKTELFENLSQDIRSPLHTLIGLLSLMMADSRPDQRASLACVQESGKRLLSTIDNLVELTRVQDRPLVVTEFDAVLVLREAVDAATPQAQDAQVTLRLDATGTLPVRADAAALRRIMDSLIGATLRSEKVGGDKMGATLGLTALRSGRDAVVRLTGPLLGGTLGQTSHTGLTLSRLLAQAMNGSLSLESDPASGTSAELRLPSADPDDRAPHV